MNLRPDEPLAIEVVGAIRAGNTSEIERLLAANPGLAQARIDEARTLLHVATDWPGHYPNCPAIIGALVRHGADVNARFAGAHQETPLHWAASNDDVQALDTLLDLGADLESPGAVIGGGTPLADAVAFAQWKAARRLIDRGARANLWQSAALGLLDRVEKDFENGAQPSNDEITKAFWCACHGGQKATAEYLLQRGADLNWIGYDHLTPLGTAERSGAAELAAWLRERGAK